MTKSTLASFMAVTSGRCRWQAEGEVVVRRRYYLRRPADAVGVESIVSAAPPAHWGERPAHAVAEGGDVIMAPAPGEQRTARRCS